MNADVTRVTTVFADLKQSALICADLRLESSFRTAPITFGVVVEDEGYCWGALYAIGADVTQHPGTLGSATFAGSTRTHGSSGGV